VNRFIALTEFGRRKFIAGGLPQDKVVVKQNFVRSDPGVGSGGGGYALFVGRLSAEKGVETLLAAWSQLSTTRPLKIAGDGPLASIVKDAASKNKAIEWLGPCGGEVVSRMMARAEFLIVPSIWYEGFPLVLVEAYAAGLPVIVSRIGGLPEIVVEGQTGLLFEPGSPQGLAAAVDSAFSRPDRVNAMRHGARHEFEMKYTADSNYCLLLDIYHAAIDDSHG
jgi:glycosyltransferase involved in cell wall biosynthesis